MTKEIMRRKAEGIKIVAEDDVEARSLSTYFEYVHLMHNALPELNFNEIDTSVEFLGRKFSSPIMIDCMTGGAKEATAVNKNLALVAEEMNLPMGLGSQRAGLLSAELAETYSVARENAPTAFLIANIGGAQLAKGLSLQDVDKCIEMIRADAIAVHLNPLQELVQPEGEPIFKGVVEKIRELVKHVKIPVIVKEVGQGISKEVAMRVQIAGVAAINVAGLGGTSWVGVEQRRAEVQDNKLKASLGELFWDWGIPTAACIFEVCRAVDRPVIASGGLRDGLQMAKALALGAVMCGMASPLLKQALISKEAAAGFLQKTVIELKSAMFGVGAGNIQALRRSRYVLTGPLLDWIENG